MSKKEVGLILDWDPLVCKPEDIIELFADCYRKGIIAPLAIEHNGEEYEIGLIAEFSEKQGSYVNYKLYSEDAEFNTIDEFRDSAKIGDVKFMEITQINVTRQFVNGRHGDPRKFPILRMKAIE